MKNKAIAIITTILLSISIFMDNPFADAHGPNNLIPTPYGTCTYEFYYDNANTHDVTIGGVTIPGTGPVHSIRYTFTHPYTGTFDIDLNNSSILNNIWDLFTSNCYLMSVVDGDTLRFAVNNAEYCEIVLIPSQYYNALFINLKNQNLTPVVDNVTAVNDILSHVSYIDGQIQNIHADTTMIRNLLISMSGYTTDSNDNIATDMDTLINANENIATDMDTLINAIKEINQREMINQNFIFDKFDNYVDNNGFWFKNYTYVTNQEYRPYSFWLPANSTYTLIWYTDKYYNNRYMRLMGDEEFTYTTATVTEGFFGGYYLFRTDFNNTSSKNIYCTIVADDNKPIHIRPMYLGKSTNIPEDVLQLLRRYTEYNNNDFFMQLKAIENAINNMSMNVNQLTVNATGITYNINNTQVNNSINTYNTDIQNVYNVENDFSTSFNTYNQQFTPDFTETMTTIQNVPDVMNNIVVDLYGLPFIKYPLLITLAGIVLIALLGV